MADQPRPVRPRHLAAARALLPPPFTHRIHVCYIWQHGSHQYTPVMLAYIPAPWILWVIDGLPIKNGDFSTFSFDCWIKLKDKMEEKLP